ncbi:YjjG family noncanonical pyrimidine nucleotidase [Bdellovibrio sp. 22V]|uniref:YjjG family noncanonical pyrimidine nucleotidase n=1 Tax=Bdellovibrio TaxID=958 RepID=UPI0025434511|nr:YjjG family noncanonical pyrimidine nucleotidase [Bdellovibrio sp. 22V]WII71066.1 YjjG family noncanonical pyrimidine nucleotidase [Bdellovibrio sp. 22V]
MSYDLFLFDLDDTLLDFKESERLSFSLAMESLGIQADMAGLFKLYQTENRALWEAFEKGQTTKDHLKVERFRRVFQAHKIDIDPEVASNRYLDALPETVVLIDHAVEICEHLSHRGEIGIITNGIHATQTQRLKRAPIAPYISFMAVSEECGYAKPDVRFFEYSAKKAQKFAKASSLMIGDRMETDILGAQNFGIDSCWFNPKGESAGMLPPAKFEVKHLSEIKNVF